MRSQDCRTSALAILSEISPQSAEVFGQVRHLTSRAGLCRGNNGSAGKRRSGRTRRGNTALRLTLTECAHSAARTLDSHCEGFHRTLTARAHELQEGDRGDCTQAAARSLRGAAR